ncbi:MAG TPA: hypothetical protein VFG51_02295 [Candidatus Saccharimonadia bacterium]|nr:hypothetical protein [Candidatus Saccharimonadia bacterium]
MLGIVLVVLIILWLLGYITIPGAPIHNITLFVINHRSITLWDVVIFFVIIWLIDLLPSPFRQIAAVILLLYTLSTLGIIAIAGLSSLLVIAMIIGLAIYLFGSQTHE